MVISQLLINFETQIPLSKKVNGLFSFCKTLSKGWPIVNPRVEILLSKKDPQFLHLSSGFLVYIVM